MKKILKSTLLLTATLLALGSQAQANTKGEELKEKLTPVLKQMNENIEINTVTPMPQLNGWYEVVHNKNNIFYSSGDGQYIFQGVLLDLKNMQSITDDRKVELNKIDWNKLPKAPLTFKKGKGENKIAVFSDVNCPHCRGFEKTLEQLDNIQVNVYPYAILTPSSYTESVSILCSKDPKAAWKSRMLEGVKPTAEACTKGDKIVKEIIEYGKVNQVGGTPVIIFTDGQVVNGNIAPEDVQNKLNSLKKK